MGLDPQKQIEIAGNKIHTDSDGDIIDLGVVRRIVVTTTDSDVPDRVAQTIFTDEVSVWEELSTETQNNIKSAFAEAVAIAMQKP